MPVTEFDDLLEQKGSGAVQARSVVPLVIGTPIDPVEIQNRLSVQLYDQLADGAEAAVIRAAERASIHVAAIFGRLGKVLNLDDQVSREVALLFTIYEMHLALGHEESGREYRIKAKDLIIAAFGDYPEADKPVTDKVAAGAITIPARRAFP